MSKGAENHETSISGQRQHILPKSTGSQRRCQEFYGQCGYQRQPRRLWRGLCCGGHHHRDKRKAVQAVPLWQAAQCDLHPKHHLFVKLHYQGLSAPGRSCTGFLDGAQCHDASFAAGKTAGCGVWPHSMHPRRRADGGQDRRNDSSKHQGDHDAARFQRMRYRYAASGSGRYLPQTQSQIHCGCCTDSRFLSY